MNNPYSASRDEMRALFVASRKAFAESALNAAYQKYPLADVQAQVAASFGPIVDEINKETNRFARETENVEFVTALGLSDFYFGPDVQTQVSFEMRRDFQRDVTLSYESLIAGIESATHIDCAIAANGQSLAFQIKRYPQAHLDHTNEALLSYLDNDVFPHYPNMQGTILVILLQPNSPPAPTAFRFPELSAALLDGSRTITFDEVALSYTDIVNGSPFAVLHKLYPLDSRQEISLDIMLKRFRGEV